MSGQINVFDCKIIYIIYLIFTSVYMNCKRKNDPIYNFQDCVQQKNGGSS